ncbi:unnamed protein product [Lymnaea stagnalis]|uniref:phospholipase A2 n=1 Tax=Lymnaea stagnalis TaxID=6523 RepID=A0AAV2HF80_LYMST
MMDARSMRSFLVVVCASLVLAENESEAHFRPKRNALQLCDIINRYTGRFCLSYNNYGCFCGLRSVGSNPLDDADRCCQTHDRCFAALPCQHLPLLTYSMRCSGSSCTCNNQNRNSCQYRSCQCDVQFGECLRGTSYNRSYRNYRTHRISR